MSAAERTKQCGASKSVSSASERTSKRPSTYVLILGSPKPLFAGAFAGAGVGADGKDRDRARERRKIIFRFLFKKEKIPDSL